MGGRMKLIETGIDGLYVAETEKKADHRGAFTRLFCERDLAAATGGRQIVQVNHSQTAAVGALRGLHFQYPPHAEMKMVRCLKGRVFDVAVDIRKNSPNFGKWLGEELSEYNKYQLFIPSGFAHGYYVISETAEITYKCSEIYHPEDEHGIIWNDPEIGIQWPGLNPILSKKDANLQNFMSPQ